MLIYGLLLQYKNSNKGIKGRGKGRKVEVVKIVE